MLIMSCVKFDLHLKIPFCFLRLTHISGKSIRLTWVKRPISNLTVCFMLDESEDDKAFSVDILCCTQHI